MTVILAQLLEESPSVEVAEPDESVLDAMERMLEYDYSQLPVVSSRASPRALGVVSVGTIARAAFHLDIQPSKLRVHHALNDRPIVKRLSDDLWRALDALRDSRRDGEVLLVEDDDGILRGILTGHDFTNFLRRRSEDSITVLDIEATVKQLILDHYRGRDGELKDLVRKELGVRHRLMVKDVRKVVNTCLQSLDLNPGTLDQKVYEEGIGKHLPDRIVYEFDKLAFNQYLQIFGSGECGEAYEERFGLPTGNLNMLLTEVRDLRNQIQHNRGLPTNAERNKLVYCRELLGRLADRRGPDAGPEPEVIDTPPEVPPALVEGPSREDDGEDEGEAPAGDALRLISALLKTVKPGDDRVTWTFDSLDIVTQDKLPADARQHRSWWTNDEEVPQSAIWREAGWRVVSVNLTTGTVTFGRNTDREEQCIAVFTTMFKRLGESDEWRHETPSPAGRSWQSIASVGADSTLQLKLSFVKNERFRVAIYIDSVDKDANKSKFQEFLRRRDSLEAGLGGPLTWESLPHRRASRISLFYPRPISIVSDGEAIEELAEWVARFAPKLYAAASEVVAEL